jgi:4-amino-4-deoxy-L-arabinose transferase-like glycosyltransferase
LNWVSLAVAAFAAAHQSARVADGDVLRPSEVGAPGAKGRQNRTPLSLFCMLQRFPAWAVIVLIWLAFTIPAIGLRGLHYEEGTVIALARGAIEDGYWLVPHHYGFRFVERPVLMSWLIAGLGTILGGIDQPVARIPAILSLLSGAALVCYFVRGYARAPAGLFAAVCLLVSPAVLQKVVTAEPDLMVSILLFAAFVIWWHGNAAGRVTPIRWIAIGLVLGMAGLTKGPQPLAYFTFGVGAFLLVRRRWSEWPGFMLAHVIAGAAVLSWYIAVYAPGDLSLWANHSRMTSAFSLTQWTVEMVRFAVQFGLELGPSVLLAVAGGIAAYRTGSEKTRDLVVALALYALCCTLVLAIWPSGAATRYAMPALPAIAAMAGLAFDRFRVERPGLVNVALGIAAILTTYQLLIGWLAMPLMPDRFQKSRLAGQAVATLVRTEPATLYAMHGRLNNNVLAYVPAPVREVPFADLPSVPTPAWALVTPDQFHELQAMRSDLQITQRATFDADDTYYLIDLHTK